MYRRCTIRRLIKSALIFILVSLVLFMISSTREQVSGTRQATGWERKRKIVCNDGKQMDETLTLKWNITQLTPPKLLDNFKNPCFYANVTPPNFPLLQTAQQIRCLPYFLIAGFPKSGTSDVWVRLLNHHDVVIRHAKELNFFNRMLLVSVDDFQRPLARYINAFTKTADSLQKLVSPALCQGKFPYHHGITGEGSVDTVFDTPNWQNLPGNENCPEPRITNADYAFRLMPSLRVILLVRNPVDRLYSDYIYESRFLRYNISRKDFHKSVMHTIRLHKECQEKISVRACAYNGSIESFKVRLRVGMYYIFIRDWLDVFPKEQILVIKTEDMGTAAISKVYQQICQFLDIRPFTKAEEIRILNNAVQMNTRSPAEKRLGDMWNQTRSVLTQFYSSYNQKLADLLQNKKFLWND